MSPFLNRKWDSAVMHNFICTPHVGGPDGMAVHVVACNGFRTCRAAEVLYWPHELDRMCAPSVAQYSKHRMAFDNVPVPLASKNLQAAAAQTPHQTTDQARPRTMSRVVAAEEGCMLVSSRRQNWRRVDHQLGTHI